jgi:selenocysteine-specific elongation factor
VPCDIKQKNEFIALAEMRARSYKTRRKVSVRHYILATAGHVDHGKSSLVKALTGTDPDRLPEEKARGITIELGFAHLLLPGFHVGIVDVPGHEDFVKNMVAGVGSIDVALLIVAADDGWMPQTEEHLQILTYLGVTRGVVALTKSDLLESGDERAVAAVRTQLEGTPLSSAPIVKTSVVTGAGMDELKESLGNVLAETPAPRDFGKPRLPVDRVFTLRGVGTVVTGTLSGGVFQRGQQVVIQPRKTATRIRTVQSHNRDVEVSPPGTRTALNLPDIAAGTEAHGAQRGDTITLPTLGGPAMAVDVLLEKSARLAKQVTPAVTPLRDGVRVSVHHSSATYAARVIIPVGGPVEVGEQRIAQLRFEKPVFMFVGDRLIIRDWSEQWTIAGGTVLDPDAPTRNLRSEARREFLDGCAAGINDLRTLLLTVLKRDHAVQRGELLIKSRFSAQEVASTVGALATEGRLVTNGEWVIDSPWWTALRARAAEAIEAEHKAHPDRQGLPLSDLRRVVPLPHAALFDVLIADLGRSGFSQTGTTIRHGAHRLALPPHLHAHGVRIRSALAVKPFEPPTRKDLAGDAASQQALQFLLQSGEAVELDAETAMLAANYSKAADAIKAHLQKAGGATASELRQLLNTNRRVIIPLLERLDREGVTVRQGDKRVLKAGK